MPSVGKTVSIAALLKRSDRILDQSVPQVDQATVLLREALAAEPEHLYALHNLSWCLDVTRIYDPGRWAVELRTEHWALRDKILAQTAGTRPGGALSLEQRARALALSQWAQDAVLEQLTPGRRVEVESALAEARALRDIPDHARAQRGLDAWRELHEDRERGYRALLARIEATPGLRVLDVEVGGREDFAGLQGVFSDQGFLAWLRRRKPVVRAEGRASGRLDIALLMAAGLDADDFFGVRGRVDGRVGRVLALRALGAKLEGRARRGGLTPLHLAAMVGDAPLVKELLALGVAATAVDANKASALQRAAEHDSVECIAPLLEAGVPVDLTDRDGRTALFEARSVAVARALLAAGADPTRTDRAGVTPFEAVAANNAAAAALLRAGTDGAGPSLPVQPLISALAARKRALLRRWYFEDADVDAVARVLEAVGGSASWDEAAASLGREAPWTAMAVVELARDLLPVEAEPPSFRGGPRLVLGSLVVTGDLRLSAPLLVTGDLRVEGVVENVGPEGVLIVAGSARVVGLDSGGEVVIGKDLEARVVWGHHNDASLRVGGKLKATVVIADDHDIQAKVKAAHHLENGAFDPADGGLAAVFVPGVFDADGLAREKVFGALRKGEAVLR